MQPQKLSPPSPPKEMLRLPELYEETVDGSCRCKIGCCLFQKLGYSSEATYGHAEFFHEQFERFLIRTFRQEEMRHASSVRSPELICLHLCRNA